MQTTIEIDDQLLRRAMQDSGESTERAVIEAGLQILIQLRAQEIIRPLRGIGWEGNLEEN